MWPSGRFRGDRQFKQMSWGAQGLFRFLWTHPDLDSAGYIAYQPRPWSNEAPDLTVEVIEGFVDEMAACGLAAVDRETGELFLVPFMRLDAVGKPFVMVSAMRSVGTRASADLMRLGWEQVEAIYPPPMCPSAKQSDEAFDRMVRSVESAYAALKVEVGRSGETVSETVSQRVSETVSRPTSVSGRVSGRGRGLRASPKNDLLTGVQTADAATLQAIADCQVCDEKGWIDNPAGDGLIRCTLHANRGGAA
jgi:hypothetical protein